MFQAELVNLLHQKLKWPAIKDVLATPKWVAFTKGPYRLRARWEAFTDGPQVEEYVSDQSGLGEWEATPMAQRVADLLQGKKRDKDGNLKFPDELE